MCVCVCVCPPICLYMCVLVCEITVAFPSPTLDFYRAAAASLLT